MSNEAAGDHEGAGSPNDSRPSDGATEAAQKGGKEAASHAAEQDWQESAQESGE
jgi:hypothetical protein